MRPEKKRISFFLPNISSVFFLCVRQISLFNRCHILRRSFCTIKLYCCAYKIYILYNLYYTDRHAKKQNIIKLFRIENFPQQLHYMYVCVMNVRLLPFAFSRRALKLFRHTVNVLYTYLYRLYIHGSL